MVSHVVSDGSHITHSSVACKMRWATRPGGVPTREESEISPRVCAWWHKKRRVLNRSPRRLRVDPPLFDIDHPHHYKVSRPVSLIQRTLSTTCKAIIAKCSSPNRPSRVSDNLRHHQRLSPKSNDSSVPQSRTPLQPPPTFSSSSRYLSICDLGSNLHFCFRPIV